MNASRRAARKYQIRTHTARQILKEGMPNRKAQTLMGRVHMFLCTARPRQIAAQALKLGLIALSPRSEHHRRMGIATR